MKDVYNTSSFLLLDLHPYDQRFRRRPVRSWMSGPGRPGGPDVE